MSFTKDKVTLKGEPVNLAGTPPEVGQPCEDFTVVDGDLNEVTFDSLKGKILVVNSVVSLDTPVCDTQMRRFNEEAARLGDAEVIVISMDLPFAQKRWCGAAGAERIRALSDHRDASFGKAFGVLIKDLRLLARAVFVVDAKGILRYRELVEEITDEPDYEAALTAVRQSRA